MSKFKVGDWVKTLEDVQHIPAGTVDLVSEVNEGWCRLSSHPNFGFKNDWIQLASKFSVGDTVRIKEDLELVDYDGKNYTIYAGTICVILHTNDDDAEYEMKEFEDVLFEEREIELVQSTATKLVPKEPLPPIETAEDLDNRVSRSRDELLRNFFT